MTDVVAAPVTPLLPQCANGHSVTMADFNAARSTIYQPNSWSYYQNIIPTVVPGLVLGCLAVLGFIFFIVWIIIQFCTCCRRSPDYEEPDANTQFIKEGGASSVKPSPAVPGSYGATHFGLDTNSSKSNRSCDGNRVLNFVILIFMLATVGTAAWGMAVSIINTRTQIPNFFGLVNSINDIVQNTTTQLQQLDGQLATLQYSTATLNQNAQQLRAALNNLGITDPSVADSVQALGKASSSFQAVRTSIESGIGTLQDPMGTTIASIQNNFEPPSFKFQDQGRFVVIAIIFLLTILCAIGASLLSIRVNHPLWASIFVALLWLCVALLMLFGVGLLSGIKAISKDTCLYVETFATTLALNKVTDPQKQQWIMNALHYYLNPAPPASEPPGSALKAVTGIDLTPVINVIQTPQITTLTNTLGNANTTVLQAAGIDPSTTAALQNISLAIVPVTKEIVDLGTLASRSNIQPIYTQIKTLACCDVTASGDNMFVAWTVAGSIALVLVIMCSVRVIRYTFKQKTSR